MTRLQATSRDEQIAVLHRAAEAKPVLAEVFTALAVALESTADPGWPLETGESWRWSQTQRAIVGLAELVEAGAL